MSLTPRVLLVEDDDMISGFVSEYLEIADFKVTVLKRGDTVVNEVRLNPPDVVLMDIMLPGRDGITVCEEIRTFSTIPILFLTAKIGEDDRLLGLDAGADDYICKPFSPRELVARIKAILRRKDAAAIENRLVSGPVTMKPDCHTVTVGENNLRLTPNEFELLKVLISQPGNVFGRSDLVSKIQGYNSEVYDRTVDVHIKNLRKKMDALLPGCKTIRTVYGMGYSFEMPDPETSFAEL